MISGNITKEHIIKAIGEIRQNGVPIDRQEVPTQYQTFMIVNIEWNDFGWQQTQLPETSGFGYVKEKNMPHETLNFKFDKPVDTEDTVYGYFQMRGNPSKFSNGETGIIFFHSKGKIVGVYGDAQYLNKRKEYQHNEFENSKHFLNILGKKNVSLAFAKVLYLPVKPEYMNNRQMGQSNLIYIERDNAGRIIEDAILSYKAEIPKKSGDPELVEGLKKLERLQRKISPVSPSSEITKLKDGKALHKLLLAKKQIILYGPPGTGKTYTAQKIYKEFLEEE